MSNRLEELDALRGIAALSVVIYHFTTRYQALYGFDIEPLLSFPLGKYGVQLFFVVSGFVIFLTLNACKHPFDFVVSRFARLYPVYWVAVLLTFSCVSYFGLSGRELSVKHGLINLSMLQGYLGIPDVDGVYWTLKWELAFYFWMLLVFTLGLQRHILKVCAAWLILQCLSGVMDLNFGHTIPAKLKIVMLITYCNLFVAGIVFYRIRNQSSSAWDWLILLGGVFNQWLLHDWIEACVTLGIFSVFYLFCIGKIGFVATRPLVYLGTISYSLYLIHEYIGWITIRELQAMGLNINVVILIALTQSLLLASALTYGVERPGMAWIRKKYKMSVRPRWIKTKA